MRKLSIMILLLLPLTFAFAEGQPVGNKMKQDPTVQERAINPGKDFPFAKGDTIVISKNQTNYLTGEKISTWVYNVLHTIGQIGSKRFPNGIMIDGIVSWVGPEDLLLWSPVDRGDVEQNAAVRNQLRHAQGLPTEEEEAAAALKHQQDSIAQVAAEKAAAEAQARQQLADSLRRVEEAALAQQDMERQMREDAIRQADSLSRYRHQFHKEKTHRFSIGVRGGTASLMQNTDDVMGNWKPGGDAFLDLQYAYYAGARDNQTCNLGVITGVSIGYATSPLRSGVDTAYTIVDSEGKNVNYKVAAGQVKENDGQLQLEIPLLFSLRHQSGLFFNVGPKLVVPVFSHYKQNISDDAAIDAYFEETGVHVTNEKVTGALREMDYQTKGKFKNYNVSLMFTAEMGYEWALRNGHNLGLGVYANYSHSALNNYSNETSNKSLIQVGMPGAGGADVDVLSATDTYAKGLGYFDCGLKLIYHFNFPVK